MPVRSRRAVEDAHGRNCVAELPSGMATDVLPTPWGTEVAVFRDPDRRALARLASGGGTGSVRFWLSPCGHHAVAWGAPDVAHFQLFCGLMDEGWHQGRIDVARGSDPVVTVQDPVAETLLAGAAARRMAGPRFTVRTSLRTIARAPRPSPP